MKGIVRNSRGSGMSRRFGLLLMVAVVLPGGALVEASVIHHRDKTAAEVQATPEWSKFLDGGPKVWADVVHPPVTPAVVSEVWRDIKTDPGGTDPMIEFLLWKQSIDPTRFAHYHPKLAPALHRISLARSETTTTQAIAPTTGSGGTTSPSTPSTPSSPPPTSEPQNLIPTPTPEPSTLLIAAGMAAWAVVKTRRRLRGA
jgi:hypothetical protein